jgi:hypothetical protein
MKRISKIGLPLLLALMAISGCDKTKPYETKEAESQVHFVGSKNQAMIITTNPAPAYTITVGTTDVADADRTVTVNVASPTGAVAGTQYTLSAGNTITIPKGQATASIIVQPNYTAYTTGRKDTLVFTLKEPSIKVAGISDTVRLALRGPCFDGEVSTGYAAMAGAYQARENGYNANGSAGYTNYGPYATAVQNVTLTSPTTATFRLTNIYEVAGWNATFTMDWSNVSDRKVTTTSQLLGPGSTIGLTGYNIYVEPPINPSVPPLYGTFSYCNQTITAKFMLGAYNSSTGVFAGYLTAATGGGAGTFTMVLTR